MFYFYKTVNKINEKFYYGSGQFDNYYGSGLILQKAIKKYGIENFEVLILKYFETREEAYKFEDKFLKLYKISSLKNSYNLKNSGLGGDTFTFNPNKENILEKHKSRGKSIPMSDACRIAANEWRSKYNYMYGSDIPEEIKLQNRKNHSDYIKKWIKENGHPFQGKRHTEESKKKISNSKSRENHHMWGKTVDSKTKDKIRNSVILSKNPFLIKITNIDTNIEFLANSMSEACAYIKGNRRYIKDCLNKVRSSYKNYTFEYVDR